MDNITQISQTNSQLLNTMAQKVPLDLTQSVNSFQVNQDGEATERKRKSRKSRNRNVQDSKEEDAESSPSNKILYS